MKKETSLEDRGGYWVDAEDNKWNSSYFTKEEALELSKTLVGCSDCVDCSHCIKCYYCRKCHYCNVCFDCSSCNNLENGLYDSNKKGTYVL